VDALLVWLEGCALGDFMRSSGVWVYASVNLVHILGVSTLLGAVLVLDLRLLGLWRRVPLATLEIPTVPLAVAGFCIAAVSGLCLISANATEYRDNPFLLIKFAAIAVGLANVLVAQFMRSWQQRHHDDTRPQLAWIGGVSLIGWLATTAAGRMIGYW
jgi:hypothetical protein